MAATQISDTAWDTGTPMIFPTIMWNSSICPTEILGTRFYEPGDLGYEKEIKEYLRKVKGRD